MHAKMIDCMVVAACDAGKADLIVSDMAEFCPFKDEYSLHRKYIKQMADCLAFCVQLARKSETY